jgi:formylglycine-generating enzyme required for sulfatase activity
MIGNVSEWTEDTACPRDRPCDRPRRVVLGYSWFDDPGGLAAALRRDSGEPEQVRRSFVGFRCAR